MRYPSTKLIGRIFAGESPMERHQVGPRVDSLWAKSHGTRSTVILVGTSTQSRPAASLDAFHSKFLAIRWSSSIYAAEIVTADSDAKFMQAHTATRPDRSSWLLLKMRIQRSKAMCASYGIHSSLPATANSCGGHGIYHRFLDRCRHINLIRVLREEIEESDIRPINSGWLCTSTEKQSK
jgi:hypothetical protein